jgi:hypothetical protein
MMDTNKILELAKVFWHVEGVSGNPAFIAKLEAFVAAIQAQEAEKWLARVAELRLVYGEVKTMYSNSCNDNVEKDTRIAELELAVQYYTFATKNAEVGFSRGRHVEEIDDSEVAVKALANKSDWLADHDLEVRRKTLEEAADWFAGKPYEMFTVATIEDNLRAMAEGWTK